MPFHIGVGGAWKKADKAHIGVGGAWKQIQKMYIGVGGVWKEFYTNLEVSVSAITATQGAFDPSDALSLVTVSNDGTLDISPSGSGPTWLIGGTAAEVEVYLSGSGDALWGGSDALNTWLSCSTTRTWGLLQTSVGVKNWSGTIQFREASTGVVLDTASVSIEASVEI